MPPNMQEFIDIDKLNDSFSTKLQSTEAETSMKKSSVAKSLNFDRGILSSHNSANTTTGGFNLKH